MLSEIAVTALQVKLVVTSRERLNLQEEWAFDVQGMRFPVSDREELEAFGAYGAVQLFLQRAKRAQAAFTLSNEESADIVRICQLVEGMPLGLELAAVWLRMMSCRGIGQEIERSLDFLTTSLRDVPERHQSRRARDERQSQSAFE